MGSKWWLPLVVLAISGCSGGGKLLHADGVTVLVAAQNADENSVGTGVSFPLEVVGSCLGGRGQTVVFPYGTKVVSESPLTVDIPRLGEVSVGEVLGGGGSLYSKFPPKGIDEIPADCPGLPVLMFSVE